MNNPWYKLDLHAAGKQFWVSIDTSEVILQGFPCWENGANLPTSQNFGHSPHLEKFPQ